MDLETGVDVQGLLDQVRQQADEVQRIQRSVEAMLVKGNSRNNEVTVTADRYRPVHRDQHRPGVAAPLQRARPRRHRAGGGQRRAAQARRGQHRAVQADHRGGRPDRAGRPMTLPASVSSACRVTVVTPQARVDVALPLGSTLVELIPQLIRLSGAESLAQADNPGWLLSRLGGAPMPLGMTITAAGIRDGDVLTSTRKSGGWHRCCSTTWSTRSPAPRRTATEPGARRPASGPAGRGGALFVGAAFLLLRGMSGSPFAPGRRRRARHPAARRRWGAGQGVRRCGRGRGVRVDRRRRCPVGRFDCCAAFCRVPGRCRPRCRLGRLDGLRRAGGGVVVGPPAVVRRPRRRGRRRDDHRRHRAVVRGSRRRARRGVDGRDDRAGRPGPDGGPAPGKAAVAARAGGYRIVSSRGGTDPRARRAESDRQRRTDPHRPARRAWHWPPSAGFSLC